jgi:hypothetical protein
MDFVVQVLLVRPRNGRNGRSEIFFIRERVFRYQVNFLFFLEEP